MSYRSTFLSFCTLAIGLFLATGAFAACSTPAGVEGDIQYNSTGKEMSFCDGTDWQSFGTGGGGGVQNFVQATVATPFTPVRNVWTTVPFDSENDPNNLFDLSTDTYTVPETGVYTFSCHMTGQSDDTKMCYVINTTTNTVRGTSSYENNLLVQTANRDTGSGTAYFTAGDTIEMQVVSGSSSAGGRQINYAEFIIYQVGGGSGSGGSSGYNAVPTDVQATTATYNGNMGGNAGLDSNCDSEFSGYTACTDMNVHHYITSTETLPGNLAGGTTSGWTRGAHFCSGYTTNSTALVARTEVGAVAGFLGYGGGGRCSHTMPIWCCDF